MGPVLLSLTPPAAEVADDEAERAARLFKALSEPTRIRLISLIRRAGGAEVCFCDIAPEFDMPQPSLSHHLGVLVKAGILARQRRGTWSWYRLLPEPLEALEALLRPGGPLLESPGR
ncbi:helix-turn-helix transcriptional regulator [Kutzneria sp. 744]|uniref:ArsR/SmtB family transcription factor n=1 Tax=Kutzneria sp. (strain 744) TaxID=345341 RepID=UPI001E2EEFEE|nr:metalloregulator ArsR/SmtB family transcription factor [Kutzneria sp. 744]